jgi:hypothetical protein
MNMTPVGFEPTQLALVELESTPLDHSGKVSVIKDSARTQKRFPTLVLSLQPRREEQLCCGESDGTELVFGVVSAHLCAMLLSTKRALTTTVIS